MLSQSTPGYINFNHVIPLYSDIIGQMEYFFQLFFEAVAHVFGDKEQREMDGVGFFSFGSIGQNRNVMQTFCFEREALNDGAMPMYTQVNIY